MTYTVIWSILDANYTKMHLKIGCWISTEGRLSMSENRTVSKNIFIVRLAPLKGLFRHYHLSK